MTFRGIIATFVLILSGLNLFAGPAGKRPIYLSQPDGTTFQAVITGDEFTRIKTTAEGHAVVQDSDGWWCYAAYGNDGSKVSSGWKVGSDTPADILAAATRIPYQALALKARESRLRMAGHAEEPIFKRMADRQTVMTRSGSEPVIKHALVILAEFKDVKFEYGKDDFINLLTEEGYSVNGATGSAKEYFDAQFNGLMEFEFHVSDIVTLPKERAYYGGNDDDGDDKNPAEMAADACELADDEIDFSLFDDDGDRKVDNVFVFFAGHDEAEGGAEECIWSHSWVVSASGSRLYLDNIEISRYACSSELTLTFDSSGKAHEYITGIGTFCHEYSHTLGLPDFYDVDYEDSGGVAAGLWGSTSLMDGGNYNNLGNTPPNYNAIERMIAGISEPVALAKSGMYSLQGIGSSNRFYKIEDTDPDIFYLLECRVAKDWDAHIGGSGMLAYRIDLSRGDFGRWELYNEVNVDPERQNADLMEADGRQDKFLTTNDYHSSFKNIAGVFYPHGSTEMTSESLGFSITSIKKDKLGGISFAFIGDDIPVVPPSAVNIATDVFADAAIIRFDSSYLFEGAATVSWGRYGQEQETLEVLPYASGKYTLILEGLEPSKTYDIDIRFIDGGIEGGKSHIAIATRRMPDVQWPYIYLGSMKRHEDGTFARGSKFPLVIYGATGAAELRWKFNGRPIIREGDGYYTVNESGTLEAEIYWEDGSVDKVMKEIKISEEEHR